MKEGVNLVYKDGNVKEFFVKASKLCKETKFNDQAKFGLIREAVKSDKGMLQFLFSRKADTFEKVRETCLEYADNQKVLCHKKNRLLIRRKAVTRKVKKKDFLRKRRKR